MTPSAASQDAKLQRLQQREDLAAVLRLPAGQRLIRRLLVLSNTLGPSYAPGDAYATAYNEGLRRMGMLLLTEIQDAAPERLPTLITPEDSHVSNQ